jgi:hypothetical protein
MARQKPNDRRDPQAGIAPTDLNVTVGGVRGAVSEPTISEIVISKRMENCGLI